ncbi:MAG: MFS transporter [Candidatus Hermodarchaeota archaeon]
MTHTEEKNGTDSSQRSPHKGVKYWAWAMGGPVGLLMVGMWGRIQYFSAHILLIPQATIFLIYLIYSIVDAVNDPLIGYFADRSTNFTEKYGKRFPWIIIGHLTQPIFLILSFIPIAFLVNEPSNLLLSIVWLTIMMCVYETLATISEVNRTALFPDLFRSQSERTKSIWTSQVITFIYQVAIVSLLIPIILGQLGGEDDPYAYLGTMIISAILSYIMLIPYAYGAYENAEIKAFRVKLDQKHRSFSSPKETLIRIFSDRNWMAYIIMFTFYSIGGILFLNGIPFFFFDGLGWPIDSLMAMLPRIIVLIMSFIGSLVFIPIIKKIGTKKSAIISLSIFGLFFLLIFLLPVALLNILCIIGGFGYGGAIVSGIYIGAEAIDKAVIKSGKREEGSFSGILRVFTAFSYALQTMIFAIVSSFTGYVSGDPSTYAAGYIGLLMQISVIPFFIVIIGTVAFTFLYTITKEEAEQNSEKLKEIGL